MSRKPPKKKVTKTLITKILRESGFDPADGGPLAVIMEIHRDNPVFLENRALEMIRESQLCTDAATYAEKSQKAIWLLAVARATREIA